MKIDGQTLSSMVISAANMLDNNKASINKMNVFPVPDGDTGINMTLTLSTVRALDNFNGTVSDCAERIANMVLRSARGNSGAILSLFFRGMAKALKGLDNATTQDIADAFSRGTEEAYKAVMNPTEGTILTVMRTCSEEAQRAAKGEYKDDVVGLFTHVLDTAETALANTPELLPVLKEANVVDAGGCGFVCLISGMLHALNLNPVVAVEQTDSATGEAEFADFDNDAIQFAYCTELIAAKKKEYLGEGTVKEYHEFLSNIGDSLVFVDTEDIIKLHVHTNHPGEVIERALTYGYLESVKVENMRLQHSALVKEAEGGASKPAVAPITKEFGFVSVCMGDGIRDTFIDLGVDTVIAGGQTMNPSTQDIIDGVNRTGAKVVYVLPNNKNIIMVAEQAASMIADKTVVVIPSKSVPQGIAAMIAFNPDGDEASNTKDMQASLSTVRTAQTTYAVRDTVVDGLAIHEGQTLGLLDGAIVAASDREEDCLATIAASLTDTSFVTVFWGEEADEARAAAAERILRDTLGPMAEVAVIHGGQPIYGFVISAE